MKIRISALMSLALAASASLAAEEPVRLIAHRGGVVGEKFAENSPASIEAAIERGYWMIEVDIRRSKDGRAIVQHDPTFERYYDHSRAVADMTWDEIQTLSANPGGMRPLLLEEAAALCEGKIRLMLDIKGRDHPDEFYRLIEAALAEHDLLESAYLLGGSGPAKPFFVDKAKLSANRDSLREAISAGEDVGKRYYLFELGSILDAPTIEMASEHGVEVVAAINTFRYHQAKVDHWQGAKGDIERLLELGVRAFQIDSIYDQFLLKPLGAGGGDGASEGSAAVRSDMETE